MSSIFETKTENNFFRNKYYVISLGCLFVIITSLIAFIFLGNLFKALYSLSWPSTKGVITHAGINKKPAGLYLAGRTYQWDIKYRYSVDNVSYTGDTVNFEGKSAPDEDKAKGIVSQFRKGSSVKVYFNKSNPKVSCLEPGPTFLMFIYLIVLLLVGGLGGLFIFGGIKMTPGKGFLE